MKNISKALYKLKYPGRGIIVGLSPNGENLCLAYFITGRSQNSKNRIFKFKKNSLQTLPINGKIKNTSLVIYEPVTKFKNFIVISNGNQTKTILKGLKNKVDFYNSFSLRNFENDPPIYTPRIAALIKLKKMKVTYKFAIIKKSPIANSTERFFFNYDKLHKGYGHLIHTYKGSSNFVQSFDSVPNLIKMPNSHDEFLRTIWESLNNQTKISLFTEFINLKTKNCSRKIININKLNKN